MRQNNFKELEKLLAENKEITFDKVKNDLVQTRSLFGFVGDLFDLFIPKIVDVLTSMSGGDNAPTHDHSKYPHEGGR